MSTGGIGLAASQDAQLDAGDLLAVGVVDLLLDVGILNLDELAGVSVGEAFVDHSLDFGGSLGQVEGVGESGVGDKGGFALGGLGGGLGCVGGLDAAHVELAVLRHEVIIVDEERDGAVVIDLNETVVVLLLGVFVDETAGEGLGHLLTVKGLHFAEVAGLDFVAAVLGEEDGDRGVGKVLGEDIVATLGVGRVAAPRVGVEAEEVRLGISIVSAHEVVEGVHEDGTNIGSRIANRNAAVKVLCDVVLHVTLNRPDVSGNVLDTLLVDDLVSGEEGQGVGEVLERFDHTEDLLEIDIIVGAFGVGSVEVSAIQRRVDIQDHVDTSCVEDGCALVVVETRRQVIDTDGVNAQTLHESGIPQACIRIAERVLVLGEARGTAGLVVDTQDLEPITGFTVHKVLSLDLDGNDGAGSGRESADRREKANVSRKHV